MRLTGFMEFSFWSRGSIDTKGRNAMEIVAVQMMTHKSRAFPFILFDNYKQNIRIIYQESKLKNNKTLCKSHSH